MRRRFFVERFDANRATVRGETAEHLERVLRAKPGQLFELSDGSEVWLAKTETVGRGAIEFSIVEPVAAREPRLAIVLWLAVVKFDRFEWAIEKATELGAKARSLPPRRNARRAGKGFCGNRRSRRGSCASRNCSPWCARRRRSRQIAARCGSCFPSEKRPRPCATFCGAHAPKTPPPPRLRLGRKAGGPARNSKRRGRRDSWRVRSAKRFCARKLPSVQRSLRSGSRWDERLTLSSGEGIIRD